LAETAQVLEVAGAYQAIFLDGGGSSILVGRGDDGQPAVLSRPSGLLNIPGTLRYVAVNLGFTNLRRTNDPIPALADWQASLPVRAWAEAGTWAQIHPLRATLAVAVPAVFAVALLVLWLRLRRRRSVTATATPRPSAETSGNGPRPAL
jgi:hypothetical protein